MEFIDYTAMDMNAKVIAEGKKIPLDDIARHHIILASPQMTPDIVDILTERVSEGDLVCYEHNDALHFLPSFDEPEQEH